MRSGDTKEDLLTGGNEQNGDNRFGKPEGGVGKSTTTYNLAAALAERGYRVLMVDLDAQAGLTVSCGLDPDAFRITTYDPMVKESVDLEALTAQTKVEGVDRFPANLKLAGC